MPQMAPLMWFTLFIFFLMMFCFFNIMNYFSYITFNKKEINKKSLQKLTSNWKW
uniref:ATP synthase complex subunit 8 n=1 Tax=Psathyromyia aragaoi TaxID=1629516 RepID=A0A343AWN3_9DIPT|nr:ATP synthase F0 subunit 8 [Psathyromyia aragaoi]